MKQAGVTDEGADKDAEMERANCVGTEIWEVKHWAIKKRGTRTWTRTRTPTTRNVRNQMKL